MNKWMNNVTYLAAMAHTGWACWPMLALHVLDGRRAHELIASVVLVLYAAAKEFFYDARYELPRQTTADNVGDFAGYCGGLALAWGVILLRGG